MSTKSVALAILSPESLPEYMVKGRALGNCVKVDHSESKTLTRLSPAANKVVRVALAHACCHWAVT